MEQYTINLTLDELISIELALKREARTYRELGLDNLAQPYFDALAKILSEAERCHAE